LIYLVGSIGNPDQVADARAEDPIKRLEKESTGAPLADQGMKTIGEVNPGACLELTP